MCHLASAISNDYEKRTLGVVQTAGITTRDAGKQSTRVEKHVIRNELKNKTR